MCSCLVFCTSPAEYNRKNPMNRCMQPYSLLFCIHSLTQIVSFLLPRPLCLCRIFVYLLTLSFNKNVMWSDEILLPKAAQVYQFKVRLLKGTFKKLKSISIITSFGTCLLHRYLQWHLRNLFWLGKISQVIFLTSFSTFTLFEQHSASD